MNGKVDSVSEAQRDGDTDGQVESSRESDVRSDRETVETEGVWFSY